MVLLVWHYYRCKDESVKKTRVSKSLFEIEIPGLDQPKWFSWLYTTPKYIPIISLSSRCLMNLVTSQSNLAHASWTSPKHSEMSTRLLREWRANHGFFRPNLMNLIETIIGIVFIQAIIFFNITTGVAMKFYSVKRWIYIIRMSWKNKNGMS